ncbi:MAG TPA: transposase, partial [Planctomycetales bacterium]|nr:transposase [Planctomycetales bacterium]
ARLARSALKPMLAGTDRLLLGIDDTPTQRYGPHVEGAGLHHNPT